MLRVPSFLQEQSGLCGPAALRMVLAYFGVQKTEQQLVKLSHCNPKKGVDGKGLVTAAKALGFKGSVKNNSSIADLRQYVLKKKIPVIVDWFSWFGFDVDGHYSVVVHIDKTHIYLRDPELKKIRKISLQTFRRAWFDFPGDFMTSKKELILRRMIVISK